MKGNPKILTTLNELLSDELTAISQYVVHAEMCANWHYDRLAATITGRSRVEMKHAEKLIERILFLEGMPEMELGKITIGANIEKMHANDLTLELGAVRAYNAAVAQAVGASDNTTRELLESILKDEEDHVDYIEAQLRQIADVGLQNYMAEQIRS